MIQSANKLKELLFSLESRCVAIIRADISRRIPKLFTSGKLKSEINRSGLLNPADFKYMMTRMMEIYTKLSVSFRSVAKNDRKEALDDAALHAFEDVEALKNVLAGRIESRNKITALKQLKGVFYVSNVFRDCAKDHIGVQGTLLYADGWKERCPDSRIPEVARFIEKRHLRSVEEVCFNYPYLITRPNCRHRLSGVSIDDALHGNWKPEILGSETKDRSGVRKYEKKKYMTVLGIKK